MAFVYNWTTVRALFMAAACACVIAGAACGQIDSEESTERVIIGDPDTIPGPAPTAVPTATSLPTPTTAPTAAPTATPRPTASPAPTQTPSPVATSTTQPTSTPAATSTPEPTSTAGPAGTAVPVPGDGEDAGGTLSPDGTPVPAETPQLSPLEAAVAELEARGEGVAMPDLVCLDLQKSQNILQALTDEFFATDTVDASGDDRSQIWDRNWVVVGHSPDPGDRIVGDPLLEVLKDDESDCGPEPVPVMFDLTCVKADQAGDILQAQTGQLFASDLFDAALRDRTPILRGRWYVVGQTPAPGEPIDLAVNPRLRLLRNDEAEVCDPDRS